MKYKALILDVDRTLITSLNARPSQKVKAAIKRVSDDHIHVSLATARPYSQIKQLCAELQLSGMCVVSGGARIIDVTTGEIYKEYCLSDAKIKEITKTIKKIDKKITFWIQDNGINKNYDNYYQPDKPLVVVIHKLKEDQAANILDKLAPIQGVFVTKTSPYEKGFIDINITHEKATKYNAITEIIKLLSITKAETVGVGDSYNDVPLFKATGLNIAMEDAPAEIKKIADDIVPDVEHNGVAVAIERYFY